jgi:hypothetical protein
MVTSRDRLIEIEKLIVEYNSKLNCHLSIENDDSNREKLHVKLIGYGGQLKNQKQKIIILIIILAVLIPFTFVFSYFMFVFYLVAFYAIFVDTIFEIDREKIARKYVLFNKISFSKTELKCKDIDRFEVARNEFKTKNGSRVNFKLIALFKNDNKLVIYTGSEPELVSALDNIIEIFLNIKDETNEKQLNQLSVSNIERVLKDDNIVEDTLGNVDTSKPSKEYPFSLQSNLISDKVIYFANYNRKSVAVGLLIFGFLFTVLSIFLFSPIGIPIFILGLNKLFNKQYLNVYHNKLSYYTKPISLRKEKELLKSHVKTIEVIPSNITNNGVPSFHLIAHTKEGKKIKLIKYVFNVIALRDICNKVNKRFGLD